MQVFNIYGQAGGSKEDKSIVEVNGGSKGKRGAKSSIPPPTLIVGDINANPEKLQNVMELVEGGGGIDVGLHADWWGGIPGRNHM